MEDATVYKVVEEKTYLEKYFRTISSSLRTSKRRFCSCVVYHLDCAVSYEIDKTTKPKFGKLFAFNSLQPAKQFAGSFRIILECKAEKVEEQKFICPVLHSLERFKEFWENKSVAHKMAPQGTVVCDSITPIKIVK